MKTIKIAAVIMLLALAALACAPRYSAESVYRQFTKTGTMPDVAVPKDTNLMLGKVELAYDRERKLSEPFRMALMIVTEDGEKIMDFFQSIPAGSGEKRRFVGTGNIVLNVPKIFRMSIRPEDASPAVPDSPWYSPINALRSFARDFPELLDTEFPLTFKDFTGGVYYLENVPNGRAYVWFQSHFDGNRVTQFPQLVELDPTFGTITRLDFYLDFMNSFHDL